METIKVNVNYEDYTCKSAYDADTNTNLVDVYDEENNFIGEMDDLELPDMEDEEQVSEFTDRLADFITIHK